MAEWDSLFASDSEDEKDIERKEERWEDISLNDGVSLNCRYASDSIHYQAYLKEAKKLKEKWQKAPRVKHEWNCPICLEIMRKPMSLNGAERHTFCKECIKTWVQSHQTNPLTNVELKIVELETNDNIAQQVKDLYVECQKVRNLPDDIKATPNGIGDYQRSRPLAINVADKFYEKHLEHLQPEYENFAYLWEQVQYASGAVWERLRNLQYPSDQTHEEARQSLKESREQVNAVFDEVEERLNGDELQQVQARRDVGLLQKFANGIAWFLQKMWEGIKWPFKKLWEAICWCTRQAKEFASCF